YGDIASMATLEHAGIGRAAIVISGISDWFLKGTSNLQILRSVRSLAPAARVIVTGDTAEGAQELYVAGADYVMVPSALTAEHLATLLADRSPNALARARRVQAFELFRRGRPCAREPRRGTDVRALRNRHCIVGVGETEYSRASGRSTRALGVEAVRL